MYAILPCVAMLGAGALLTLLAVCSTARRRQDHRASAGFASARAPGGLSPILSERSRPRLVVSKFGGDPATRPDTGTDAHAAMRLDRLREALDQLTSLLLIGASGEGGQARFLASLGDGEHPVDQELEAAALAMRRLGTLMLSVDGGEAFLIARSAASRRPGEMRDTRAIWEDFLAALAFLTGACRRTGSTIHLDDVDATAQALEHLCLSLSQTELLAGRLYADRAPDAC